MIPVSQFKISVTEPNVHFLRRCSGDFSLIDDISRGAVSIHRAQVRFAAIAVLFLIVGACWFVN